jgi:hypothetical protein
MQASNKIILFYILSLAASLFGAADSSDLAHADKLIVTVNGNSHPFERNTLMRMPYFRAQLFPALYMRAIPSYAKYINTFKDSLVRQTAHTQSIPLPEGTDLNDFMFLYNLLDRISNIDNFTIDQMVKEIAQTGYSSPERMNSIFTLAQKLLTLPPVLPLLDQYWIHMIQNRLATPNGTIAKAFFAPQENMLESLLALIKAEKSQILIACYRMTNPEIICELAKAAQRGVRVNIVLDAVDGKEDTSDILQAGIHLYLWERHWFGTKPKMHNKFFIFTSNIHDKSLLVTGSANCTWSAQEVNEENIVVLDDPILIADFTKEFNQLRYFSKNLQPSSWEEAHAYISKTCFNLDEKSVNKFTPLAPLLFSAIARLFAKYVLTGLAKPYGINSLDAEAELSRQLKLLSQKSVIVP